HRSISEQDKDVNEVMSEIEDMGVEFVEALRCIADVLNAADHGNYTGNSLAIDICKHPEGMGFSMFQCFPLKRSFIPSFIPLDLGIVASHISGISTSQLKEIRKDVAGFWHGIFKTE